VQEVRPGPPDAMKKRKKKKAKNTKRVNFRIK
jgi:hypothetical protein